MNSFDFENSASVSDHIFHELRRRIISGELVAGEWFPPEREMAEQMGVSRGSLHKAILALEYHGFVAIVPRKGTVVKDYRKDPTPQSLAALMDYGSVELEKGIFTDMMDFRIWLEAECARRACTNIYGCTLEEMRSIARNLGQSGSDPTEQTFRFHYLLTQASGNSVFSIIFKGFEATLRCLIHQRFEISNGDCSVSSRQMLELTDAIVAKDEDAAELALRELLTHGIGYLETRYK